MELSAVERPLSCRNFGPLFEISKLMILSYITVKITVY
jgi:hypothetical protein